MKRKLSNLSSLWPLISVLTATFPTSFHAGAIKHTANNGITESYIFDAAAAEEDHRVLLKIVAHTRNIRRHFYAVRKAYAGDLADSRVRLLRCLCSDLHTYTTLERRGDIARSVLDRVECAGESDRLRLPFESLAASLCELIDSWHSFC